MARIRTIKPDFWKSEKLSALPEATHMLAAQLLNYSDDYGYFNANPKLIQAEVSPLREPSRDIRESLVSLQTIGYIRLGRADDGRMYGQIVEFSTHQKVAHPTPSKIADLPITWTEFTKLHEEIAKPPETFTPDREQGTGNKEEKITPPVSPPDGGEPPEEDLTAIPEHLDKRDPTKRGTRLPEDWTPTAEDIAFAKQEGLTDAEIDRQADRFRDHWLAKPGAGGRKCDWHRTWCNWIRRAPDFRPRGEHRGAVGAVDSFARAAGLDPH